MFWPREETPQRPVQIALIVVANMIYWMILLAAIGFGALYLGQCPVQPYIPIYLIVLGVSSIVALTLSYILPACSNGINVWMTKCCGALLYIFIFCWFIAGTRWVYNVYPPSYSLGTDHYCHQRAYQFAFLLTTLHWAAIALLLIYTTCFALLTCCIGANARRHLIPSRNTSYGAIGDDRVPIIVGDTP